MACYGVFMCNEYLSNLVYGVVFLVEVVIVYSAAKLIYGGIKRGN